MATTVSFTASMRTRKTSDSSNYKSSAASQEFYTSGTNFVGIVHFSGLSLLNKVIIGMTLRVTSAEAGFGAGTTKTVYLRKSKYQAASQSGITGGNYYGDALGTYTGSFYGNTTSYDFYGALFYSVADYLQAGNNTFCLYNPSPSASGQGYSYNYLQWSAATLFVTYEEGVSQPRVSAPSVDMGAAVTVYTDRLSTAATHTISYSFSGETGQIGSGISDSVAWTPPITLAQRIPSATSGLCTITCDTYYAGVLTGTKTCTITLTVPGSVVPTISGVNYSEAVAGIAAQFTAYVQNKSKLAVSIAASGAQGSTITTYRTTLNGTTYTASSFTTNILSVSGDSTLSVTVTDSRGRTATTPRTISVLAYTPPTLSLFKAERCNSAGTAPQTDGNRVRVSATAGASSVGSKNTMNCTVFYKLSSASVWTQSTTIAPSNYAIASTNLLLSQTFDPLSSFDFMLRVTDYFPPPVEQSVSIGTKQVMMDFYRNGTGIAFGKVAEVASTVEFGWPLMLVAPLTIAQGGTGANSAAAALAALGAAAASHTHTLAALGAAAASHSHALNDLTGPLSVAKGGTGASGAKSALINLGIFYADTLPASGTDGQICLVPVS
ncbi:MAG: DUF859 family phage minor structural protein [Christensenellaceae bacterium]|nr:DUF859 family phage minor structural protein [Christensenellaceae bacterium]